MFQRRSPRVFTLLAVGLLLAVLVGLFMLNTAGADGVVLPWDTPPKYRIAYLVGNEPLVQANHVGPDNLQKTLGTRTVRNWSQVKELDQKKPLDALVIHKNALALVNKPELANLYQRGVVVATLNVDAFETAALLNDSCTSQNDQGTQTYKGTFAIISTHLLLGSPDDVALIKRGGSNCGSKPVSGVKGKSKKLLGIQPKKSPTRMITTFTLKS